MRRVWFSPEALEEIRAAVAWWRINRPKGPQLLRNELRRALSVLEISPLVGALAAGVPAESGIRFLKLRGSRFLLYYSVNADEVEVLRFWHASRGTRPFSP